MHIITRDDIDFPILDSLIRSAPRVGTAVMDGQTRIVVASEQFLIVTVNGNSNEVAIKPVRSMAEAKQKALEYLSLAAENGATVKLTEKTSAS